jgi:hypothetical protein
MEARQQARPKPPGRRKRRRPPHFDGRAFEVSVERFFAPLEAADDAAHRRDLRQARPMGAFDHLPPTRPNCSSTGQRDAADSARSAFPCSRRGSNGWSPPQGAGPPTRTLSQALRKERSRWSSGAQACPRTSASGRAQLPGQGRSLEEESEAEVWRSSLEARGLLRRRRAFKFSDMLIFQARAAHRVRPHGGAGLATSSPGCEASANLLEGAAARQRNLASGPPGQDGRKLSGHARPPRAAKP